MQQSNIAANTQVTEVDIAYLAGLWDGEGSIVLTKNLRRKGNIHYIARCQITNTSDTILCRVIEILDGLEIPAHLIIKPKVSERHRQSYDITVHRLDSIKKLLGILIPYLHGKKAIAKLMLRYVNIRLKYLDKGKYNVTYGNEEHSLYEQMRRLNQKGTSEATRETEIKDMVHTS